MTDILGKEIVGYEEACYLKEMHFDGACTGYYHCDDYGAEEDFRTDDERYECVGWRGLYRNSYSLFRAAAPSVRAAKIWYTKNKIKPYKKRSLTDSSFLFSALFRILKIRPFFGGVRLMCK